MMCHSTKQLLKQAGYDDEYLTKGRAQMLNFIN